MEISIEACLKAKLLSLAAFSHFIELRYLLHLIAPRGY
jgi:hypothetical protein